MALEKAEIERRLADAQARLAEARGELSAFDLRLPAERGYGISSASQRLGYQVRVDSGEAEVAALELELMKLADRSNERDGVLLTEQQRVQHERREFWFRRFHLSMGIAHGAGLAAITSKVFDSAVSAGSVAQTWWAMFCFAAGLILAGAIPISLYFGKSRVAWGLASVSAGLFIAALAVAVAAAWAKAVGA